MNVIIKTRGTESLEKHDYRDMMSIYIDGNKVFCVSDGEPEDANLSRDFNDCLNIGNLMKQAYAAGKSGKEITFRWEEI